MAFEGVDQVKYGAFRNLTAAPARDAAWEVALGGICRYVAALTVPKGRETMPPIEVTPADEVSSAGAFCVWRVGS